MALQLETVAIPVVKGINVTTSARLLDSVDLLEAENVRFPTGSGAKKRRGHTGARIRGAKAIPPSWTPPAFTQPTRSAAYFTGDRSLPSTWLFGFGYTTTNIRADATVALETSAYPESGLVFGAATRDNESLIWDGQRLLSRTLNQTPGGRFSEVTAVIPSLRAEPIAKANIAQNQPDCADNGVIRVAAWITGTKAYYSVVDSVLGSSIVAPTLLDVAAASQVRCIPVGDWVHMVVADPNDGAVQCCSIHQDTPSAVDKKSLGSGSNGYFDIWKHSDTNWLVAISQTTQITVRWLDVDGTVTAGSSFVPDIGGGTVTTVGICAYPTTSQIGLIWRDSSGPGTVKARVYSSAGVASGAVKSLGGSSAQVRPVAIAPKWALTETSPGTNQVNFNAYWDNWDGTKSTLWISRFTAANGVSYSTSIFHKSLASSAFRVGDRTFIWAANRSDYQSTWLLLDETLRPVGHCDYVSANTLAPTAFPAISSMNWWGVAPAKDRCVYHCGLGFRVRIPVTPTILGVEAPAVYSEPSIRFAQLDFLPRLHSAQAGRSTYLAGAQLWSYDGADLTEAGFHLAPENVTTAPVNGGLLTASGKYIYRIDLCYRNAQNEEIRSASFFTSQLTLAGSQGTIDLTIPTVLTRRSDAYFLIFRNETVGTVWYLVNSRDPSSALFLKNDQTVASLSFSDATADASLLAREQHPGTTLDYLDQFPAPACEVVAAGRDRLWISGGEIPPGQVYPSRLFIPGETPSFHGGLAIQVDRSAEEITAIGFLGEHTAVFRANHCYIIDGEGPDNIRQGFFTTPRLALTDVGAVGPEMALTSQGLFFQSPAGIRLLTPGSGIQPIGQPVDSIAKDLDISAAVVIGEDQEVRFYSWDGPTLVFNYQYGTWSTWTVKAAGALRSPITGLAVVATPTGTLLEETDGVWTDNGAPYRMRVRFAWLHAGGVMDFQRVRRIGALGSADTEHSVHVDIYYNERDFPEETFDWDWPDNDSDNQDLFGDGNFGDGTFGDVLP